MNIFWEHVISYGLMALMFTLMFKFIGDAKLRWKEQVRNSRSEAILSWNSLWGPRDGKIAWVFAPP